jgi:hypothetical protein
MLELRDQIILWWLLVLTSAYWLHVYWRRYKTDAYLDDGESPPEPASHDESLPYQKKWFVLSMAERTLYDAVCQAAGSRYLVLAKVRLFDLLWVPENTRNREYHMSRVMSKRVDFAVCHAGTQALALVIELEDASRPMMNERASRDTFVDQVLRTAGIPILRVPLQSDYAKYDLGRCIEQAMRRPGDVTMAAHSPAAYGSHAAESPSAPSTARA